MSEFLEVPLKRSNEVDLVQPFKALIKLRNANSGKEENLDSAITEFNMLRQAATNKNVEKQQSYLDVMVKYHDQLLMLETKFSPQDITIPFKWKDAFDKGSMFGGKPSLTIMSLLWERCCVLFNIGALQSQIASMQNVHTDDGLKMASKLFQQSSGIFDYLKELFPVALGSNMPTSDIQKDTLVALSALMLAQAQESFALKGINDKMKDATVAKLVSQTHELYSVACRLMQKDQLRNIWDRDWLPRISARSTFYGGVAEYYQSCVCNQEKRIGEEIVRSQAAIDQLKTAQSRFTVDSATMAKLCNSIIEKASSALATARKDNDFIYHDRIPELDSLQPIPKAAIAKPTPIKGKINEATKDLFEELAPASVQNAIQGYETRKAELINSEIGQLREATQLLNGVLASLNLPAALEESQGQELPPSLKDRAAYVRTSGGKESIDRQLKELPDMLTRNDEILTETDRMLRDEKSSDDQLRAQFGSKWARATSDSLTEKFRTDLAKYRGIISNARTADNHVKSKYDAVKNGVELLSLPEEQLAKRLPTESRSLSPIGPCTDKLRELMGVVREIQREREAMEKELTSKTVDIKSVFINALNEGNIDEESLSSKILEEAYGPLQARTRENLLKQKSVLTEIEEVANKWMMSRGDGETEREKLMKELATACDTYEDLKKNLSEGGKFYSDLTQLLVAFQSKVSDYCFARKTEKEDTLKGLTSTIAASQHGSPPSAPRYHEELKQPPPRPPQPAPPMKEQIYSPSSAPMAESAPSSQPPTLPYPVQSSGMPLPNYQSYQGYSGQYSPYTPMPGGYNPYGVYHPNPTYPPSQVYPPHHGYPPQQGFPPQPFQPQHNPSSGQGFPSQPFQPQQNPLSGQGFPPQSFQPQQNTSSGQGFPGQYLVDRVFNVISHIPVAGPQVKKIYDDTLAKQGQSSSKPSNPK